MTVDTFLANFERLADAPNGIPKLRELILQLAVRGKLVPQDPNDEPASELLKRIDSGRQPPVDAGRLRVPKGLGLAATDTPETTVLAGWQSVPLGRLLTFEYGKGISKADRREGNIPVYGANGVLRHHDQALVSEPCIVVGRKGSAGALNRVYTPCWPSDVTYYVVPPDGLDFEYSYVMLRSAHLEGLAKGIKPGLNRNEAYALWVLLPPLTEQKRIVAKVDELMALCDELEVKQKKKRTTQISLNRACLHALTSPNGEGQTKAWHRVRDHFDDLYTVPETVAELRQAILQLAVMGRLVPQDPADEPASELIKRIQAEQQRLIAEGTIRKPKPLLPIDLDETTRELPATWEWARFGDVAFNRDGERIPLSREERARRQGPYDYYGASGVIDSIDDFLFDKPLLLIGEDGANLVNRSTPIAFIATGKYWVNNHAHVLDGISLDMLRYIELFINAIDLMPYITGTAQPKMNQAKMNGIPVAIPPEHEQQRIVAKVDRLVALCDDLEAKLVQAQQDADNLLTAIVHELVGSSNGRQE